jgi:hypothetical protein
MRKTASPWPRCHWKAIQGSPSTTTDDGTDACGTGLVAAVVVGTWLPDGVAGAVAPGTDEDVAAIGGALFDEAWAHPPTTTRTTRIVMAGRGHLTCLIADLPPTAGP